MTLIYQHLHLILITFIVQTSHFEPITLPQVGLVAGSLGLTLGYGMGWYISLASTNMGWHIRWSHMLYNRPGMGSVSYAMPGELLSPEDKVP